MRNATLLFILLMGLPAFLIAQDSSGLKLLPLDEGAILERLEELKQQKSEPLIWDTDSTININVQYSMKVKEVDQTNMANMPMMDINEDIHYTMQIKRYNNYYGKFVNKDSLAQRKRKIVPLKAKD